MLDPAATTTGGSSTVRQVAALGLLDLSSDGARADEKRVQQRRCLYFAAMSPPVAAGPATGAPVARPVVPNEQGRGRTPGARPAQVRRLRTSPFSLSLCSLFLFAYCLEKKIIMLQ